MGVIIAGRKREPPVGESKKFCSESRMRGNRPVGFDERAVETARISPPRHVSALQLLSLQTTRPAQQSHPSRLVFPFGVPIRRLNPVARRTRDQCIAFEIACYSGVVGPSAVIALLSIASNRGPKVITC